MLVPLVAHMAAGEERGKSRRSVTALPRETASTVIIAANEMLFASRPSRKFGDDEDRGVARSDAGIVVMVLLSSMSSLRFASLPREGGTKAIALLWRCRRCRLVSCCPMKAGTVEIKFKES